jgi:hypothetical protein
VRSCTSTAARPLEADGPGSWPGRSQARESPSVHRFRRDLG